MIKSVLLEKHHEIQTGFGILDHFYSTGEINMISLDDQKSYRSSFVRVSTKYILLYIIQVRIRTRNKVIVCYNSKKNCIFQTYY